MLAGRLAQMEGQTNNAVEFYLDLIRFAHESNRGGMIIHTATARTHEALAMEGLKSVEPALAAAQCRRIAATLEAVDARQEPWADYFRHSLRYRLRAEVKSLFSLESWQTDQNFRRRFYQAQLQRRQVMLTFAARAFELETGAKPANAAALVPAYLKAIPNDPVSGRRLALPP